METAKVHLKKALAGNEEFLGADIAQKTLDKIQKVNPNQLQGMTTGPEHKLDNQAKQTGA
jgi:hypothetical protein